MASCAGSSLVAVTAVVSLKAPPFIRWPCLERIMQHQKSTECGPAQSCGLGRAPANHRTPVFLGMKTLLGARHVFSNIFLEMFIVSLFTFSQGKLVGFNQESCNSWSRVCGQANPP